MPNDQNEQPEGFTLDGEQGERVPAIYAREPEPSDVGGAAPGFDGASVDDNEVTDDGPAIDDDI